ncbi:MAG: YceD family protein [bacterium]
MLTPYHFSYKVKLAELEKRPIRHCLDAMESERQEIAQFLDVDSIVKLSGCVHAEAKADLIKVEGTVDAILVRKCVVSLESFEEVIREDFTALYQTSPLSIAEDDISLKDELPDYLEEDFIDFAEQLVQQISLCMATHPRKGEQEISADYQEQKLSSPFAGLDEITKSSDIQDS